MYHANLLASVVGAACRTPVLWNIRAVPDVNYGRQVAAINAVLARMSRMPAAVVINSEYGREFHARQGYRPVRWNVIPNGFDTSVLKPDPEARQRLRQEWGIGDDELLVGLVARLDPVKDHLTFLKAARELADQEPGVRFVCVGSGPEAYQRQLHEATRSLGLTDHVIWTGARTDIVAVNNALDVATCASLSESFPNVVGEAMACGTPCVVTDVGDSGHLVGSTGVVVRPGDPAAMAAAWAAMLAAGPSRLEDRGLHARQRVVEHFGLDRVVGEYEKLYSELVRSA